MNIVFDFGAVLFRWRPAELLAQAFPGRAGSAAQAELLARELFGHAAWHALDRGLLSVDEVALASAKRLDLPHGELLDFVRNIGEHLLPMEQSVALLHTLHQQRSESGQGGGLYFLSNMPVP